MKKSVLFTIAIASLSYAGFAQKASSSAGQSAKLVISDAIDIKFVSGSSTGNDIPFTFSSIQNFVDGVVSTEEPELLIRSNKDFNVSIRTKSTTFTGPTGTSMSASVLQIMPLKQPLGSSLPSPFSSTGYAPLSYTGQTLFQGCSKGWAPSDQNFKLRYKALPNTQFPSGNYSIDVEYTATQQ